MSPEQPTARAAPAPAPRVAWPRPRLARRWREADRGMRVAIAALCVLLAGAVAVRLWLTFSYGTAFLGFGDSHEYLAAAAAGVFHDVQKPAGYPIFLALLHSLSARLSFTIAVQHVIGVATGVILFAAVAGTGAPPWLGLAPAAVALFGGTGVMLEHALLADPLFAFLQALGLMAGVFALREQRTRWALLAGLAVGLSFWVKTVALSSVVLLPLVLALGAGGGRRRRARAAGAAAGAALALVLAYPLAQAAATGYWGYERQGAWNLYGRVATFADCGAFTPPAGTGFLCPAAPLPARGGENFYQYAAASPAVRRYGGPARAPASADGELERFSIAAITGEPLAYAGAILRSLGFYVDPRDGEGYTPTQLREALLDARSVRLLRAQLDAYYPGAHGYVGSVRATAALATYDDDTRVEGVILLALLLAAAAGAIALRGRQRAACLLFTLTALLSTALAAAGNGYDARYGYPQLAPLAAGAALGAWGLARRLPGVRRAHPPGT